MLTTLESLFNNPVATEISLAGGAWIVGAAIVLGLFISFVYTRTHSKEGYSQDFAVTLVMLPIITAIVIFLVGSNIARAFSLAGVFTLIRFRSAPGDPKDIAYIFFTMAVGLACGMGYVLYAAVFAVILCATMAVLTVTRFGASKTTPMLLNITIPEDLNYQDVFDETLAAFTSSYTLIRVKSTNFGSLFELRYQVQLKNGIDTKQLLDKLRCLNGNLTITLVLADSRSSFEKN